MWEWDKMRRILMIEKLAVELRGFLPVGKNNLNLRVLDK